MKPAPVARKLGTTGVDHPDGLNNTLLFQGCALRTASTMETEGRMDIPSTEGVERSLWMQAPGHRSTTSEAVLLTLFLPPLLLLFSHSVQFSPSVVSDSLRPHGLQHIRLHCPSLSPRVCSNSCLLSWWCYLTISSQEQRKMEAEGPEGW